MKSSIRLRFLLAGVSLLVVAGMVFTGCTAIPEILGDTRSTGTPDTPNTETAPAPESTPTASSVPPKITTLEVWVPPQFWSEEGQPGQEALQTRLEEFTSRRPQIEVNVRVKALTGPGGILESLRTAREAAPLALPDVILLSRSLMEQAAKEQLIYPLDGETSIMQDENWYSFARQLSLYNEQTMGVPFFGDVYMMTYRTSLVQEAPADWEGIVTVGEPLAFPASDPQAIPAFMLYSSLGGEFGSQGESQKQFDPNLLLDVFKFLEQSREASVMPYWMTQFETHEQAWNSYVQGQSHMAFLWVSDYIQDSPTNTTLTPIPTREGKSFTMANGWLWSVVGNREEQPELSIQLVEFLSAPEFSADWCLETGYVPPRSDALSQWEEEEVRAILEKVLPGAEILPPREILQTIGPLTRDAVVSILKDQRDPQDALDQLITNAEAP